VYVTVRVRVTVLVFSVRVSGTVRVTGSVSYVSEKFVVFFSFCSAVNAGSVNRRKHSLSTIFTTRRNNSHGLE